MCCMYPVLGTNSQISNKGFNVKFNDGRCHISFDSRVVAYGTLPKSLYYLDLYSKSSDINSGMSVSRTSIRNASQERSIMGWSKESTFLAHCRVRKFELAAFTAKVTRLPFRRPGPLEQLLFSTLCTPMSLVRSTSRL